MTDNQHALPVKFPSIEGECGSFSGVCDESNILVLSRSLLWYIGGQKWWDLARYIAIYMTPTKPLFTPNNVEFWTKWVEMSPFWPPDCRGGGEGRGNGEQRDESKADHWEQNPL